MGGIAVALERGAIRTPVHFVAEATVLGAGEARPAFTSFEMHPASVYVGMHPDRWFAEPRQSVRVAAAVVDLAGNQVSGTQFR